ncbi:MAG: IS66-like element accessory protein TnpA [Janthinobacterium lividum]
MDGVMQIITGRERRRRWSVQDKLRIVGELAEPGARACDVAARHGVCESLVFTWRRQLRDGVLVEPQAPTFLPVRMLEAPSFASDLVALAFKGSSAAPIPVRPQPGLIEIELGGGRQVRVGSDVNLAALRRVLAALKA